MPVDLDLPITFSLSVRLTQHQIMKPKDPVWNMFTMCDVGGKTVAKCKDCNSSVSAKSDRLRNHKQKCGAGATNTPKKRPLEVETLVCSNQTLTESPAKKKTKVQSNVQAVDGFYLATDAKTKIQLDVQITKEFYSCNPIQRHCTS